MDENPVQGDLPLLVRQPIFDRDKAVWGYELVAEDSLEEDLSGLISGRLAAMAAICSDLGSGRKLFLNLGSDRLLDVASLPMEMGNCVFGICSEAVCSSRCAGFADCLHERGAGVALENGGTVPAEMVGKYDIIKVSLKGKTPPEIVQLRQKYKDLDCVIMGTGVDSWEAFEGTRALGFDYFQGSFFTKPQKRDDDRLSASSIAKLQLLRELNNPACELDELVSIISTDISLSYRILKYINSASFGLIREIRSIQQAISLLGLDELRRWATVVVMTDLDTTSAGEELAYMALQRARFLSKLGDSLKSISHSSSTLFMLGLFSKLDALLNYPMEKAVDGLPLERDIKEGLCGADNEYGQWLAMLMAVETGRTGEANAFLERYGVCLLDVATQYMQAATWAVRQLPEMKR
ncbi:HDOD domain-containing protein [Pseudodesulfovibrio cashew]|uniref:HDOD domain-containing protein n=1 Tax=Pseudodesulfovibrio cashew TaxID=2678688 RepID=A0A6I6JM33_9BACT|nr:HDOD domain-containing protein [Pseudodesulfovibrio cashew]QGY41263.1 HDOD domain-containing protein [Pseudodesulfovibrio cashew]